MFAFSSLRLYIFLMTSFFLLSLFMALIFKLNASPFGIYFDVRSDTGVRLMFGFEGNLFGLLDAQASPNWGGPPARGWGKNLQWGGQGHSRLGLQSLGAAETQSGQPSGTWRNRGFSGVHIWAEHRDSTIIGKEVHLTCLRMFPALLAGPGTSLVIVTLYGINWFWPPSCCWFGACDFGTQCIPSHLWVTLSSSVKIGYSIPGAITRGL